MTKLEIALIEPVPPGPLPGLLVAAPYGMKDIPYGLFMVEADYHQKGCTVLTGPTANLLRSCISTYPVAAVKAALECSLIARRALKRGVRLKADQFLSRFVTQVGYHVSEALTLPNPVGIVSKRIDELFLKEGECVWVIYASNSQAFILGSDLEVEAVPLASLQNASALTKRFSTEDGIYDLGQRDPVLPERLEIALTADLSEALLDK
ncbi:MAG: hypothetical protein U0931_29055 [Vulcanimicrobiota bacterium]